MSALTSMQSMIVRSTTFYRRVRHVNTARQESTSLGHPAADVLPIAPDADHPRDPFGFVLAAEETPMSFLFLLDGRIGR